MRAKVTITTLREKVARGEKITMLTGYDYPLALAEEKAGVDIILVGDSLGMTVLGYESTLPVRMDTMIDHAQAVRRAAPTAYVIGDMPYLSYQVSVEQAVANAGRFMKEAGCDAVKLEGGRNVVDVVAALTKATIPVMGHIGLTPQSIAMLGGFKSQGRSLAAAETLIEDAKALEEAGAVAILLEAMPPEVARIITARANIPVIGIGAGPYVHGQLLIVHDMLGFFEAFTPKFVKKYADLNGAIRAALAEYIADVTSGAFPAAEHCYKMQPGEAEALLAKYNIG
ncbi:MAG TPA: 3-methyl-2-oxobutanoate hydroxymethyltransferase [Firmicutes bacterium]|jgi:3-methyl-2-oxobutanoate hydroxymethyltransferase|uniref:3-methyl-2-oxobutanoate hydroxymethyltransferase n=1 Tax=Gelria sp. Kuro-4 TaxID=2796927 RepID=UPI001982DF65|nr:3-methyl-2-oxobutanoate hydroxymethyltransferase [Gelria sp. Kuro-4]MDK2928239.1 3-methyl-2-oxobutanoate hydroxymethyltransferase [Bacillota bacterium]BCV23762.1 3-methyl-2-oxobutanoate hydroxymethyltransferase [Gelria sp. Kuro-4]HHV56730.1 3-methyl-2-oxobutanoate hydroxymethyltransferase [Bacillota bacterium]